MERKRKYVVGFMLFLMAYSVQGQPYQRRVLYETITYRTLAVDCGVELDSLSPLDFMYLQAKPALNTKVELVIKNDWLTAIRTYPQQPYYDECDEFPIGKSVSDVSGTTLYDHAGNVYYNLPNNNPNNEDFMINSEEIANYGVFNNLFSGSGISFQQEDMNPSIMYSFYDWGPTLLITMEEERNQSTYFMEREIDFSQLYMETRTFIDGIHQLTIRTEYKQLNDGWIIPKREKRIFYGELPSETRYQITETDIYLSYMVISESDSIVGILNHAFDLEISPNPADDSIRLHFSMPMDEMVNIKIMNIANAIVEEVNSYVSGDELQMNIIHLNPNMYTILCTSAKGTASASFVKDGIGQYSTPNPVTINVHVFPNPAQDYIKVRFPLPIDASMQVKVMDVLNNVYFNYTTYVSGNTLQIDVTHLPFGIYYIVCINNDGTATAKFMKM